MLSSPGRELTLALKREQVCTHVHGLQIFSLINFCMFEWRSPWSTRLLSGSGPSPTHRNGFIGWWVSVKKTDFCIYLNSMGQTQSNKMHDIDVFSPFVTANNTGSNKRQITDLVDQSIQITSHCFVVTADNCYILVCGFWDKSFRVYASETGRLWCNLFPVWCVLMCGGLSTMRE